MSLYRYIYHTIAIPVMEGTLLFAGMFNRKIRTGIRGRRGILKEMSEWRKEHPGTLAVVHSASAGEYEAGIPLIRNLQKRGIKVVATLFSPSGYSPAKKSNIADFTMFLPFDSLLNTRRFLKILQPDLFVFCKHDIWPGYVWECNRRKIPVCLVNANMHRKSFRLHPLGIRFNRNLFRRFSGIWAVNPEHARRIEKILGAGYKVESPGDTRFDRVVERAKSKDVDIPSGFRKAPVFIGGSVWQADEFILKAFIELQAKHPDWKLIWTPHEPTEANLSRAEALLDKNFISHIRYSARKNCPDCNALLIDEMGILAGLYRYTDIAYIGGGFGKGVHSVIEPAAFGIPVIFGPAHHVSAESFDLLDYGGGFMVEGADDALPLLDKLISDDRFRKEKGTASLKLVKAKAGVANYLADELTKLIKSGGGTIAGN